MSNSAKEAEVAGLKVLKAIVWIVYALATAAIIIIAFAFFLLLFGASAQAGFAEFIYTWGSRFAAPFAGMIKPTPLPNSSGVIAWSALFAIAAYAVVAWLIGAILNSISRAIGRRRRPATALAPAPAPAAAAAPSPGQASPTAPAAEETGAPPIKPQV